jgi:hypothetical protein
MTHSGKVVVPVANKNDRLALHLVGINDILLLQYGIDPDNLIAIDLCPGAMGHAANLSYQAFTPAVEIAGDYCTLAKMIVDKVHNGGMQGYCSHQSVHLIDRQVSKHSHPLPQAPVKG